MKFSMLIVVAMFALCCCGTAQNTPPQSPTPANPVSSRGAPATLDPQDDGNTRLQMLARMRRQHSDASGKVRPELALKGITQVQRMAVANPGLAAATTPQTNPK
jgi:hypothetical protein